MSMCSQSQSQSSNMNHGHRFRHAVENTRVIRRKFMKHMVEKRRRNRINDCLENMRSMVLAHMGKNPTNYTKMEKADILEMTVKFVETLKKKSPNQRSEQSTSSESTSSTQDFQKGFQACQQEIAQFLDMAAYPKEVKSRLVNHLQAKQAKTSNKTCLGTQSPTTSPSAVIQPKVITPQEFTALRSHVHHGPMSSHHHHISPPIVLPPSAYHPHYLHSPAQVQPAMHSYPGAIAVPDNRRVFQPLSIDISPRMDNMPPMQPLPAGHPDNDEDVWRPW